MQCDESGETPEPWTMVQSRTKDVHVRKYLFLFVYRSQRLRQNLTNSITFWTLTGLKLNSYTSLTQLWARRTCPTKEHAIEGLKKMVALCEYIDFRYVGIDTSASGCIIHTSISMIGVAGFSGTHWERTEDSSTGGCKQWPVAKFIKSEILMLIDFHNAHALRQN